MVGEEHLKGEVSLDARSPANMGEKASRSKVVMSQD